MTVATNLRARHCEERSDAAIQEVSRIAHIHLLAFSGEFGSFLDCFVVKTTPRNDEEKGEQLLALSSKKPKTLYF